MKATTVALLMGFASLHACASEDPAVASLQQDEIIDVHGCRPGTLGNGEVCIDPLEGGGDGGGGGPTGGEGGPSGPGGGGGGGSQGGPGREPDRKQCGPEMGIAGCLDCCYYNHDKVDGWDCRKKRTDKAKDECWKKAIKELGRCQVEVCGRHKPDPILTITVP